MALFSKKEDKKKEPSQSKEVAKTVPASEKKEVKISGDKKAASKNKHRALTKQPGQILLRPRITEKATYAIEQNAYVFEVAPDATKRDIATVVKELYNVTPRKVNIVRKGPRIRIRRARRQQGHERGLKKAIVFLKKGDKIELI